MYLCCMKIAKSFALVFLLTGSLSYLSTPLLAQSMQTGLDRLNGNALIEQLADQRKAFNKNHSNHILPKSAYIINREKLTLISFNGLDYYVKNNRVIGIRGLKLSDTVLSQITDKLLLLDSTQFKQSELSNMEHFSPKVDFQKIRNIDRQFMLTLKCLSSTVRDIAALTKNENPSLTVENNIAKMRLPNIDKAREKSKEQTLVSLVK